MKMGRIEIDKNVSIQLSQFVRNNKNVKSYF